MNATQCKMARVATGLGLREIAARAGVSPNTVSRLERGEELKASTIEAIRSIFDTIWNHVVLRSGRPQQG